MRRCFLPVSAVEELEREEVAGVGFPVLLLCELCSLLSYYILYAFVKGKNTQLVNNKIIGNALQFAFPLKSAYGVYTSPDTPRLFLMLSPAIFRSNFHLNIMLSIVDCH